MCFASSVVMYDTWLAFSKDEFFSSGWKIRFDEEREGYMAWPQDDVLAIVDLSRNESVLCTAVLT